MKNGFTLIEIMIVMAILGILAIIAIPAFTGYKDKHQSKTSQTDVNYYKDQDTKRTYISNDKRSTDMVTLKQHSDGAWYACDSDDVCKKVKR